MERFKNIQLFIKKTADLFLITLVLVYCLVLFLSVLIRIGIIEIILVWFGVNVAFLSDMINFSSIFLVCSLVFWLIFYFIDAIFYNSKFTNSLRK
jgi:hypothetical protein